MLEPLTLLVIGLVLIYVAATGKVEAVIKALKSKGK
jgi:hypothetical protein